MKLVITRRPETNKDAGLSGDQESPSPKGQEQLSLMAEKYRNEGVQAIIHSTQSRAAIAAKALAQILKVPAIGNEGLHERNLGDWDSWAWPQVATELNKLTIQERYTFVPPHGESWQQMEGRLEGVLAEIVTLDYDSTAVITHWGSIRALLPLVRGEPRDSTLRLDVENGQIFVEDYQHVA